MSSTSVVRYNEYGRPLFGVDEQGGLNQLLLTTYTYNDTTSVNNFHYFGGQVDGDDRIGTRIDYQYGDNTYNVDFDGDMSTSGRELAQLMTHILQLEDKVPVFQVSRYMEQDTDLVFKNFQMSSLNITIGTDRVITYSVSGEGVLETGDNLIASGNIIDNDELPIQYWSEGQLIYLPIRLVNIGTPETEVFDGLSGFKITDFTLNFSNTLANTQYTSKARLINPNNVSNDAKLTITYEIDDQNAYKVYSLQSIVDRTEVKATLGGKDANGVPSTSSQIIIGNKVQMNYESDSSQIGLVSNITENASGGQVNTFTLEITLSQSQIKSITLV